MTTPAERLAEFAGLIQADITLPIEVLPQSGGPAAPHPDLAEHDAMGLATDAALTTHAGTAHGTQPHSHPESEVTSLVADLGTKAPSVHSHSYEPAGAVSAHEGASNPHPTYATDTDLSAHALTPHGGSSTWTSVIKTADESKNNLAAVADDALLKFTTTPNTNYVIRLRAWFLTNATADLKYRLVHGGTTTRVRRAIVRTATGDVPAEVTTGIAFDAADVILSTTGLNPFLQEDVILQVGASGGLLALRWSQVTSNAGPTTCLEGSYLEYALT